MKRRARKSFFTLVEVLIAMGICVFGVCSIMVLFPIGAAASRDAVMFACADDAYYQIKSLIGYCFEIATDDNQKVAFFNTFTGWGITKDDLTNEDISKYGKADKDKKRPVPPETADASKYIYGNEVLNDFSSIDSAIRDKFTKSGSGDESKYMKFIKYDLGSEYYGTLYRAEIPKYGENACWVSVWPEPVKESILDKEKIISGCVTFHIEVAWPADVSDANRQKKYYDFDVFLTE